jgi:hypothetical protein
MWFLNSLCQEMPKNAMNKTRNKSNEQKGSKYFVWGRCVNVHLYFVFTPWS